MCSSDLVEVIVCDGNGGCDTALIIIVVTPVSTNTPPDITSGNGNLMNGDTLYEFTQPLISITICFDGTDAEGDNLNVSALISGQINGTVSGLGSGDTCFTYTPDSGFLGIEVLEIIVCDDGSPSLCDTIVVIIDVTPAPPVANDDAASSDSGAVVIDVLANDTDPNLSTLTLAGLTSPSNGSITTSGGMIIYTPDIDFCGIDTFTYTVCNIYGLCDIAQVIITVVPAETDGDGIPDYVETLTVDTDNDGVPNYLSLDSDGDGIPDSVEALGDLSDACNIILADTDGDGIPDYMDLDSDGDGIPDSEEWNNGVDMDCDEDGIPDYRDPDTCIDLLIPQGFSPNGDGSNDLFVILGLDAYPENTIVIYNRWGNKVFESVPYNNDWDGTNQFGLSYGERLPEGTYFYLLILEPGESPIQDYIYITR